MKKKIIFGFFLILTFLFFLKNNAFAIEDPFANPNNKMGVHILFTSELNIASKLINSDGDWGYVTIPIQAGDRDLEKWQKFMNSAKLNHVIPIIRLATEGNYFNTSVWRKPTKNDVVDFVNFLNSLDWPVKNRYVVVFNEVNRGDEWDGNPNPQEYAQLLSFAVDSFKSRSDDFFIISAGLDNGAANIPDKSINEYDFMTQMDQGIPGIFNQIDGLGSHSYPNPGFSRPPLIITNNSISSFKFEKNLVYNLSGKNLPVFITETGWSKNKLSEDQIALYFKYAFESVWNDNSIVAVTPFLLQAGVEPFSQFSLLSENGDYGKIFLALAKIPKMIGKPSINKVDDESVNSTSYNASIPVKIFSQKIQYQDQSQDKNKIPVTFLKWVLKLPI